MARRGAPTGKWQSLPPQLDTGKVDLRQANARLMVRRPDVPEVEIQLEAAEFVIGRHASEVDLALDDELVSKRHARLTIDERGYFTLEDLGSRNGIEYLGRSCRRLNLVDGDVFKIGKTELTFKATMPRFQRWGEQPEDPAGEASIMAKVEVPQPEAEPEVSDEEVGWDPNRPAPGGPGEGVGGAAPDEQGPMGQDDEDEE